MQRRTLIKQLVFATGAVMLVPSCVGDTSKATVLLKKISISGKQEKTLAELSETIIPATDAPGAKDISAHLFMLTMVDDCYTKEDQDKFLTGLKAFDKLVDDRLNKSFVSATAGERASIVQELEAKKTGDKDLEYFYSQAKRLTIQAYTTSKFYLTKVQVYKLVPGKYSGCVPVNKAS